MANSNRLTNRSKGGFNPQKWIEEGDGLFASSSHMRNTWQEHRLELSKKINNRDNAPNPIRNDDWSLLTGLPRTTMLLLGYSVEMFLKAGISKAYQGCSNEIFERDIKRYFGHNLNQIAQEISFSFLPADVENLTLLESMVLVDARYPLFVEADESHANAVNEQTARIWSTDNFRALTDLAIRSRDHATKINCDESNPAFHYFVNIDQDGYLCFRCGGHLPPRVTYRLSLEMRENGNSRVEDIKSLFNEAESLSHRSLLHHWDKALILEDGQSNGGKPKTIRHQEHRMTE